MRLHVASRSRAESGNEGGDALALRPSTNRQGENVKTIRNLAALAVLTGVVASSGVAYGHATYNLSGYGSGLAGSTNGADGSPTVVPPATWTNGDVVDYAGGLPAMWYSGMHSNTQVRIIQTGGSGTPPSGSLLQQVDSYNASNDPDLPTDRVLAVGGKSWSDPGNENQGWGHGLDYGLIHYEPIGSILSGGPVKFTVTVTDDPTDSPAVRLAFALYKGWDTNPSSSRHQTFVTSPSPVDDPLGSAGLTLVDFAVATSAGATISRSFELDESTEGEYTLIVGALGGVAGQYEVVITTTPYDGATECEAALAICEADLATSEADLAQCQADLAAATVDEDGDGIADGADQCPATTAAAPVDAEGCSLAQFCSPIDATTSAGKRLCIRLDWQNDEPMMNLSVKKGQVDCKVSKQGKGAADDICVPAF
jgi:hypothetical protein